MVPRSFLSLCILLLLSSCNAKHLCDKRDADTLLEIKQSFGNPALLYTWNASTDCCRDWAKISCDVGAGGRVTDLHLQDTDLAGTISSAIGRLSQLTSIFIDGNHRLSGTIPPSISQLQHLSSLQITNNPHLSGSIPNSLCSLPKLESLHLYLNNLTGSIPGCFGNNISSIDLSYNRLSGPIPSSFMRGSTARSVSLSLQANALTGPIPASLGSVDIDAIDISNNQFTDASVLFGEEKKTTILWMYYNKLAFDMSNLTFPLGLKQLQMPHNRVTGTIPAQVTKLKSLAYFDVSDNRLCGPIPSGKYIESALFDHNKCLCGNPLKPCRH